MEPCGCQETAIKRCSAVAPKNRTSRRPSGFFAPRPPQDWFLSDKCTSYYNTSALKATLERLIDFDRINGAKETRLSVGAVNVRTSHFAYFDSEEIKIRPEQ
jgi:NTE family protein